MATPTLDQLLLYAVMAGDHESVARHLRAGAAPDFIHPEHGTALAQATRLENKAIIELLLGAGADPNLKDLPKRLREWDYPQKIWKKMVKRGLVHQDTAKFGTITNEGATPAWLWRLLRPFETRCVVRCCSWQAFDLSEAGVRAALEQGCSVAQLRQDLGQALAHAEAHEQPVAFEDFDMYWSRDWSAPMLHHLNEVIDRVAGHP